MDIFFVVVNKILTVYLTLETPRSKTVVNFSHANIKTHKSKNRFICVSFRYIDQMSISSIT